MRLLIRAESRKLRPLLVLPLVFIACLTAITLAAVEQNWAFNQKGIVAGIFADKEAGICPVFPPELCNDVELQAAQDEADREFAARMLAAEENAARQQTLTGSADFVTGLFLSALGVLVVVMLAAVVVASEWDRGTITPLLLAESRLNRILLAKAVVIWLGTLAIYAVTVVMTWAFGTSVGVRLWPVDHALIDWPDLNADALRRLLLIAVVLFAYTVFAVLLASITRGPIMTFLGAAFTFALMNVLAPVGGPMEWTPIPVIGKLAEFRTADATWDHISMYVANKSPSSLPLQAGVLSAVFLLVMCALHLWSRRSDLVE